MKTEHAADKLKYPHRIGTLEEMKGDRERELLEQLAAAQAATVEKDKRLRQLWEACEFGYIVDATDIRECGECGGRGKQGREKHRHDCPQFALELAQQVTSDTTALDAAIEKAVLAEREKVRQIMAHDKKLSLEENEALMIQKLSDLLTGGNAGTWDEIVNAIQQLAAAHQPLVDALEQVKSFCPAAVVAMIDMAKARANVKEAR